jgi:hypothetical protein
MINYIPTVMVSFEVIKPTVAGQYKRHMQTFNETSKILPTHEI